MTKSQKTIGNWQEAIGKISQILKAIQLNKLELIIAYCQLLRSPPFPVQTPVLYGFCQMLGFYIFAGRQICNGAAYF